MILVTETKGSSKYHLEISGILVTKACFSQFPLISRLTHDTPRFWLMLCQLSSLYPLSALDWTLSHLSAISPHADRLTDNRSLTQSLGTATFLTSLEFIHAMTPPEHDSPPSIFTWMSPCVTRIHCYPGYLAIMTPDPGPFCNHLQRLPMVLTSHGLTTHVDPWHIFRELASTSMITELIEQPLIPSAVDHQGA